MAITVTTNPSGDLTYVQVRDLPVGETVHKTITLTKGDNGGEVLLDLNNRGEVLGIEILHTITW